MIKIFSYELCEGAELLAIGWHFSSKVFFWHPFQGTGGNAKATKCMEKPECKILHLSSSIHLDYALCAHLSCISVLPLLYSQIYSYVAGGIVLNEFSYPFFLIFAILDLSSNISETIIKYLNYDKKIAQNNSKPQPKTFKNLINCCTIRFCADSCWQRCFICHMFNYHKVGKHVSLLW